MHAVHKEPNHTEPERGHASPVGPYAGWTVLTWDHQRIRLQLVNRIITELGAQSRVAEELSTVRQISFPSCCKLAVVALGGQLAPSDLALGMIRTLKQKGLQVLSYEEGTHKWPLGLRCQVLMAGSSCVLDSSMADFEGNLRRALSECLQVEAGRLEADERIKSEMRKLGIVGESQAMISVFRWILRVSALSDLPILITGETGTGKELIACSIYRLDPKRCNGPFVPVNCGAISSGLAESELFGHRYGAFTGASRDRKGLIRSAQGGVLFLDEIGEMELSLQTKLLRVLQENYVLGVGEDQEVPVNVRVIAASNRDLDQMVRQGKFRADLYHRLNVLAVHIPPLWERPQDIQPLIEHFLRKHQSVKGKECLAADPDFIEALMQVELPGNARQLENIVMQGLVNKDNDTPLSLNDLPSEVWQQLSEPRRVPLLQAASERKETRRLTPETPVEDIPSCFATLFELNGWKLWRSLEYCERLLLESALRLTHGNQSQAAQLLGITPRSVYNKIHKHSLHFREGPA